MNDSYNAKVADILKTIRYATIATADKNGKPWNSPVAYAFDDQLNLCWVSDKQNQHSQNIRANKQVFIVIYDSTVPDGEGVGVYIDASAVELVDPDEIIRIRKIKKGADYDVDSNEFLGDSVRRMYKATPVHIWVNDAEIQNEVFIRDYRAELKKEQLIRAINT